MNVKAAAALALVMAMFGGLTSAAGQSADSNPGINRPVTAQEIDQLRRTIYDETRSSFEAIFQHHTESGDLNNRLDYYRAGARLNLRFSPASSLYVTGLRTPYSSGGDVLEAT